MAGAVIRPGTAGDLPALEQIYTRAFPDEDLHPVLRALVRDTDEALSLVAEQDGTVIGHVVMTLCGSEAGDVALLGPLAVDPPHHGRGTGSALVHRGLEDMRGQGAVGAVVLGDPNYYQRFGFEAGHGLGAPHPLPAEWADAWRAIAFGGTLGALQGTLTVPPAWDNPVYWS